MYKIFEELCRNKGVSAYRVSKETGITTATITCWKQGKYEPKSEKLQKLADYFGVSLEYLMTGEEKEIPAISDRERKLLNSFSMLPGEMQDKFLDLIEASAKDTHKNP